MGGDVHQDKGRSLIVDVQCLGVCWGFPPADVALNFPVVQGGIKFLNEVYLTAFLRILVSQVVQHPQPCVYLLH